MSYDHNRNPVKKDDLNSWTLFEILLILLALLCALFSPVASGVCLIVGIIRLFIRYRKLKAEEAAGSSGEDEKKCELCDMPTDTLIPVVTTEHGKTKTIHVCEDCYHANVFRTPKDENETPVPENRKHLLYETPVGRDARIGLLSARRASGKPLQEDLFLEDIEDAKTVRKIFGIWTSYEEFRDEYPEIDTVLSQLKKKEAGGRIAPADVPRLKEELQALFHGEDLFTIPDESGMPPLQPVQDNSQAQAEFPAQPEQPEIPEQKELPAHLLYCRKCKRLYSGDIFTECGKNSGRTPEPDDLCFLIDLYELQANILDDAFRQRDIPFLKDQISGVGDVFREQPPMRGIFRFYTLFSHFAEALSVLDCLPISSEPDEEE